MRSPLEEAKQCQKEVLAFQLGLFANGQDFEQLGDVLPRLSRLIDVGPLMGLTLTLQRLRSAVRVRDAMEAAGRCSAGDDDPTGGVITQLTAAHISGLVAEVEFLVRDLLKWGCEAFAVDDKSQALFILGRLAVRDEKPPQESLFTEFNRYGNGSGILRVAETSTAELGGRDQILSRLQTALGAWVSPGDRPVDYLEKKHGKQLTPIQRSIVKVLGHSPDSAMSWSMVADSIASRGFPSAADSTLRKHLKGLVETSLIRENPPRGNGEGPPRGYWLQLS